MAAGTCGSGTPWTRPRQWRTTVRGTFRSRPNHRRPAGSVIDMTAEGGATQRESLVGGMVNAGAVFRRGSLVERPAPPTARALHAHLLALKEHGFDAAPTPV